MNKCQYHNFVWKCCVSSSFNAADAKHVLSFKNMLHNKITRHDLLQLNSNSGSLWATFCINKSRGNDYLVSHSESSNVDPKNVKQYNCDQCEFSTSYRHALTNHKLGKHGKEKGAPKKYKCNECDYQTVYRHSLKSHKLGRHSTEKPKKCDQCDYATKFGSALSRHKRIVHTGSEPKKFKCQDCPYATNVKSNLNIHISKLHVKNELDVKPEVKEDDLETEDTKHVKLEVKEDDDDPDDIDEIIIPPMDDNTRVKASNDKAEFLKHCTIVPINDSADKATKKDGGETQVGRIGDPNTKFKKKIYKYKKLYCCKYCEYKTKFTNAMKLHIMRHSRSIPFLCDECDYRTISAECFTMHKFRVHNIESKSIKEYHCHHCDYKAYYKFSLVLHMAKHIEYTQYKCEQCSFTCATKYRLARHVKRHSLSQSLLCDMCPFKTKYQAKLLYHMKVLHKVVVNQRYSCDFCDYSTNEKWRLTTHLKKSKKLPRKCVYCPFISPFMCQMRLHRREHELNKCVTKNISSNNPAKVPKVNTNIGATETANTTRNNAGTAITINDHNIDSERVFIPEVLKRSFGVDNSNQDVPDDIPPDFFWKEIPVIVNKYAEKPFACSACDFVARFKSSVQIHYQRKHFNNIKPFTCSNCSFRTSTKTSMQNHTKKMQSPIALKCGECNFESNIKCTLREHTRNHYLNRCQYCPKSFKSVYALQTHCRSNHGVDPIASYVQIRADTSRNDNSGNANIANKEINRQDRQKAVSEGVHTESNKTGPSYMDKYSVELCETIVEEPYVQSYIRRDSSHMYERLAVLPKEHSTHTEKAQHGAINYGDSIGNYNNGIENHSNSAENCVKSVGSFANEFGNYMNNVENLFNVNSNDDDSVFNNDTSSDDDVGLYTLEPIQVKESSKNNDSVKLVNNEPSTSGTNTKLDRIIPKGAKDYCKIVDKGVQTEKFVEIQADYDSERPYLCPECEYRARFRHTVRKHYQRHHCNNVKPYQCAYCPFKAATLEAIKNHVKGKNKKKMKKEFKCGTCDFVTNIRCQYNIHINIHKRFICDECPYACNTQQMIRNHKLLHTGQMYRCSFCDFQSINKNTIITHETRHTNDRKYKCDHENCNYTSNRTGLMESHLKRVHGEIKTVNVKKGRKRLKPESDSDTTE